MTNKADAEPVRLVLERTGGFAGIRRRTVVDAGELPPEEAARILELVDQLNLDAPPTRAGTSSSVRDEFQYELTVTRSGRRWQLRFRESEMTPELRRLVGLLRRSGSSR